VRHLEHHVPAACPHCACNLSECEEAPVDAYRHQVVDAPPILPEVDEYQLHYRDCPQCGTRVRASLPPGVPRGNFGPRVVALVAVMAVAYHLSKRQVKALLRTLLGIDIALGAIVDAQNLASKALAAPVNEVQEALKQCKVAHQDETKWPEAGKSGYAWVTVSGPYAYYEISRSRGGDVARSLLGGSKFNGYVVTDRYVGYTCYPMERRGICHAHLERDYQKIVDRGEDVRPIGEGLLALEKDIFKSWHAFKNGEIGRADLQQSLVDIAVPYEKLLFRGMQADDSKVAGMCENLHKHWEAIWNFGWVEGMEPTNNEGERGARHLVVFRKKCYGTQSPAGSLFVGRMATVFETCRRQGLNVLGVVTDALRAHMHGTSSSQSRTARLDWTRFARTCMAPVHRRSSSRTAPDQRLLESPPATAEWSAAVSHRHPLNSARRQ
jgi:transposase